MKEFSLSDDFFTHSKLAQKLFLDSALYKQAKIVCAFCSLKDEIQTYHILEQVFIDKKHLALPKVEDDFFYKDELQALQTLQKAKMNFYFVNNLRQLKKNHWDIYEPDSKVSERVSLNDFANAVFIVPGLAFSKTGKRLGRGKGFYDSFLGDVRRAHFSAPFVGFCFDWQVLDFVPTQEHDQTMTHLATERGVTCVRTIQSMINAQ